MPETYGLPEPEETARETFISGAEQAIAGGGIVRRVLLYVAVFGLVVSPAPVAAVIPLVLLMATDSGLNG